MKPSDIAAAVLDAIDEPALVVRRGMVEAANRAALELLGQQIVGRDLRFAIRHPQALNVILAGESADLELVGIGSAERPWLLSVRPLPGAPVSAPLHWDEVNESLEIRAFTIRTMPERLANMSQDPLREVLTLKPNLLPALEKLAAKG